MSQCQYTYNNDRSFTDSVHDNIAVNVIYPKMGWTLNNEKNDLTAIMDSEYGIDYYAKDNNGRSIVIQERFRRSNNSGFDDLTLRYEREENPEEIEQKSEFFKIKGKLHRYTTPFYMVYGIVNSTMDNFEKYVVLDLRQFFEHFKKKEIIIDPNSKFSKIKEKTLYCGVNKNTDHSSSFMCVRIQHLSELFNDVVIYQNGFINVRTGDATNKQINFLKHLARENGFILLNEDFITKADASQLISFLKDKEKCKSIYDFINSGDIQKIAMFLSTKKQG